MSSPNDYAAARDPGFTMSTPPSGGLLFSPLRPHEFAFTAEERSSVTILFGGLTWKHERLIEGLLSGAGYRCQRLPETDRAAHELGKEFCASGLCNPVYFTVGNLIRFLQRKENSGLSRADILNRYLYFTAASCGPCRFGMYESEFRAALKAAGFDGFRVLSFSQDHGIYASTGHSGLQFSVDFGMNTMHTFILGDLLEQCPALLQAIRGTAGRDRQSDYADGGQDRGTLQNPSRLRTARTVCRNFCFPTRDLPVPGSQFARENLWSHLYGDALTTILPVAAGELKKIEVDWLRVRPVVKVIGEFWAQMTESDGNFHMLEFLEKEGAEVSIEPISSWLLYLLHQRKTQAAYRQRMAPILRHGRLPGRPIAARLSSCGKRLGFTLGARIYLHHFRRLAKLLGLPNQPLRRNKPL